MVFVRYNRATIEQHNVRSIREIKEQIHHHFNLNEDDYYFVSNGKRIDEQHVLSNLNVTLVPRLIGGKGGFGSMLRAIGAQIEKTTNREACRDLSGRRLRDVNEEKRKKELLKTKKEQEQRAIENRRRKLEKCLEGPKLELIEDKEFNKIRSNLPESLQEAINEGLKVEEKVAKSAKASTESEPESSKKRPRDDDDAETETESTSELRPEKKTMVAKKKRKLWIDDDIDSSCDSELSENEK